jgi:hypothetical protein
MSRYNVNTTTSPNNVVQLPLSTPLLLLHTHNKTRPPTFSARHSLTDCPLYLPISPYTAYHMTTQVTTNPQVGTGTTPSYQRHKHPTENVYSAHYSRDVHASIISFDELRATQQFRIAKVHDRDRGLPLHSSFFYQ